MRRLTKHLEGIEGVTQTHTAVHTALHLDESRSNRDGKTGKHLPDKLMNRESGVSGKS
jgi:hypothetical protein